MDWLLVKNNHSMDVEITPYQLSRIKKLYAEPNTWQSEFELNMKSNGYFLAPSHGSPITLAVKKYKKTEPNLVKITRPCGFLIFENM